MKITQEEVKHVAKLARLQLSQQELETYTTQLDAILGAFQKLSEVELPKQEQQAQRPAMPMREDFLAPTLSHEAALKNAPAQEQDGFSVPKIVEK